ncbi:hypothetical protein JL722_10526 [Aureococcus anophagefferens]|nr:hypothetical protein JL722_10526 [Aureococcus anophagefferens]
MADAPPPGLPTLGAPAALSGALADFKEQDRFLPIANIARIMKGNLPDNAKISKDAKEIVQECVSEFISFVTSEASDKCAGASRRRRLQFTERAATTRRAGDKRKTINGGDVLTALQSLGFDRYDEPLRIFLEKYREKVKLEPDATSAREAGPQGRRRRARRRRRRGEPPRADVPRAAAADDAADVAAGVAARPSVAPVVAAPASPAVASVLDAVLPAPPLSPTQPTSF